MVHKMTAIIMGSFLMGIGINGFIIPHHLLDGGFIGLGLILHYYYDFPPGLSLVCLSIPVYTAAWFYHRKYFFYSLSGLLASSIFIDLFEPIKGTMPLGILPSAVIGGILVGCGIGLMLRYDTSTCGSDLLAQLLSKAFSVNVGLIIFIMDALIISSGIKAVGWTHFFYSFLTIISVAILTIMMNRGRHSAAGA
ncbi:YitT family protein [Bacillus infantis]|uniref:YitT family protein n=1 Tax=Bacillus infantis TaxID=324767 RepID=A0A5D4R074_9BACI|nr:YitT family protein [Bacillus infantis]